MIGGFGRRFGIGLGRRREQIAEDRRGFGSESGRRKKRRREDQVFLIDNWDKNL